MMEIIIVCFELTAMVENTETSELLLTTECVHCEPIKPFMKKEKTIQLFRTQNSRFFGYTQI